MLTNNTFISVFLCIAGLQYAFFSAEMFPFSSFGMYKTLTPESKLREYSIQDPSNPDVDGLFDLGDRRFYLQYRLDQIEFTNSDEAKQQIKSELKRLYKNNIYPYDSRIFVMKYWHMFSPSNYKSPDMVIKIPLVDLSQ